jgi:hypothetical protein
MVAACRQRGTTNMSHVDGVDDGVYGKTTINAEGIMHNASHLWPAKQSSLNRAFLDGIIYWPFRQIIFYKSIIQVPMLSIILFSGITTYHI